MDFNKEHQLTWTPCETSNLHLQMQWIQYYLQPCPVSEVYSVKTNVQLVAAD